LKQKVKSAKKVLFQLTGINNLYEEETEKGAV